MFSGDVEYLTSLWEKYKLGMNYPLQFIDSSGLANVSTLSALSDWGRGGMSGRNIEVRFALPFSS